MSTATIILITLVVYKVVLLAVGFWASRRVNSEEDFFLGGQGLGAWTAGLSYAASTSSAWVLFGFTNKVFTDGVVGLWLVPGIFFGYFMTWFVMGPKLNAETREHGHITIVDFMTHELDPGVKRLTRIICALIMLFCFALYISPQLQAAGEALSEVFGISMREAIFVGALIIIIYCMLGGFWAASITDAMQAVVMVLACIIVPIMTLSAAGGIGAVIAAADTIEPKSFYSLTGEAVGLLGVGIAMGLFGTGFGAMGQPQLLNRIMAVKSQAERKRAAFITIGWGLVIYSGLVVLAFSARALQVQTDSEDLFLVAATNYLPAVLAGIVTAAVLSAIMSTVDSLLLAAASAVSHDMGIKYPDPKRALFFGRLAMAAVTLAAVMLALFVPGTIFNKVLFVWVALGAAFGPTVLTRCFGWKVKSKAVLAAILAGFLTAVIFHYSSWAYSGVVEKWGSWAIGLLILTLGRVRKTA